MNESHRPQERLCAMHGKYVSTWAMCPDCALIASRFQEAPAGWSNLTAPLIEQCVRDGIAILQVKEKFGSLRFYIGSGAHAELQEAIRAAEHASLRLCQKCGCEASQRSVNKWIVTLCDIHAKESAAP